jgi:hypothetical protein
VKKIFVLAPFHYGVVGFIISSIVQIIAIGEYLDNAILSDISPLAIDAYQYVEYAASWRNEGFTEAFSDLARTPGYPALIYIFTLIFPSTPYLAIKIFQLILVGLSVGVLSSIISRYFKGKIVILYSLLISLIPIWYFTPQLLPESLCFFLISIILLLLQYLVVSKDYIKIIIAISVTFGLMVYLKPNNIIFILFILFSFIVCNLKKSVRYISLYLSVLFVILLPWFIHAEESQGEFFSIANSKGVSLYIGTGMPSGQSTNQVLADSAKKWRVSQEFNTLDVVEFDSTITSQQMDKLWGEEALKIWKKRPLQQIGFSTDKILIAFGLKTNSLKDLALGIYNLIGLLSASLILHKKEFHNVGAQTLIIAALLAIQAALFQVDRRFIISILPPLASVSIFLASLTILTMIRQKLLVKYS